MKKLIEIISKQAYVFMLAGMIIIATGVLFIMRINQGASGSIVLAWGISGVGLVLYLTGRIGIVLNRKNRSR